MPIGILSGLTRQFRGSDSQQPSYRDTTPALGHLEFRILEILWQRGECAVRDIVDYLNQAEATPRAYTTAMTTLDRLFKKNVLSRRKVDRAFFYSPVLSRDQFDKHRAQRFISGLPNDLLISCLVDAVEQFEPDMLDELEEEIRKKRKELNSGARR